MILVSSPCRAWLPVALFAWGVLFVYGCSSDGDEDSDGDGETGAPTEETSREATPASAASQRATATNSTARATATPAGAAPTFAAGNWTAGEAVATTSGAASISVKGALLSRSTSSRGTTRLIFADGTKTISISISTEFQPFALSVYDGQTSVTSGNSPRPCEATYKQADDKRIEGSFRCEEGRVEVGAGQGGTAVIEGTFLATR